MKNIIAFLFSILIILGGFIGFDNHGNVYWGQIHPNGNYHIFDSRGNYQCGWLNRNGFYYGFDNKGNYNWGWYWRQKNLDINNQWR